MQILIAPDSFEGSLTSFEVAENIEKGIKKVLSNVEILKVPIADGRKGIVRALVDATKGEIIEKQVTGPLGEEIEAYYGLVGNKNVAVIEMAVASGMSFVSEEELNPFKTTTYGTGELIEAALKEEIEELIIFIGESVAKDGGVGMGQALGINFLDSEGEEIEFGGGEIARIKTIDTKNINERIYDVKIRVACEFSNSFYIENESAKVCSPQKGVSPEMAREINKNLHYLFQVVKRELGKDINQISCSRAAGGLVGGLIAFCDAELESSLEIVLDVPNMEKKSGTLI